MKNISRLFFDTMHGEARSLLSAAIQQRLFQEGYMWAPQVQEPKYLDAKCLKVNHNTRFLFSSSAGQNDALVDEEDVFVVSDDLSRFFDKLKKCRPIAVCIEGVKGQIGPFGLCMHFNEFHSEVEAAMYEQRAILFPERRACRLLLPMLSGDVLSVVKVLMTVLEEVGYKTVDIQESQNPTALLVNFVQQTVSFDTIQSSLGIGCLTYDFNMVGHIHAFLASCLPIHTQIKGVQGVMTPAGFFYDKRKFERSLIDLALEKQKQLFPEQNH